ncbi:MAG: hypothetical protein GYB65_14680, partial [Chloroflexi bacterium]|nr:hypothetical protein [Chloroflexota bacterium]
EANAVPDADLPDLLNRFDTRQVLHVTYGSVLDRWGDDLKQMLDQHEDVYAATLKRHFDRHLDCFSLEGESGE